VTGDESPIPEREPEKQLPRLRKAAGAKLTQSAGGSEETWLRGRTAKTCGADWRASLVPAAAVIPAPGAHIHVAAVKTSVVGARHCETGIAQDMGQAWDAGDIGTDDGNRIGQLEVKIEDLRRTIGSEGDCQGCLR
jgi:hypothetical protein